MQKLGSIHKNQTVSERRGPPPGFAGEQKGPPESDEARRPVHPEGGRPNEESGRPAPMMLEIATPLDSVVGARFAFFVSLAHVKDRLKQGAIAVTQNLFSLPDGSSFGNEDNLYRISRTEPSPA